MANILVVDDEFLIRSLLKKVLQLNKHDVAEASDGIEALQTIDPKAPPDLIFIDHKMPRLSGIECAKYLKALYPFLKIVLLSGSFGADDDYLAASKHLFTDVLLKPFQIRELVRTVECALGGTA